MKRLICTSIGAGLILASGILAYRESGICGIMLFTALPSGLMILWGLIIKKFFD